jgi:dTDP-4-dehydrorhamnose reductase
MKKIIVGKGKVSNIIKDDNTLVFSKSQCDVTSFRQIDSLIVEYKPDVLINCAAKTNLEYCEENKAEAYEVNTLGAINCLKACEKNNIKLVHISSGCLFDGNNFIATEQTETSPSVWYTRTKDWADSFILNYGYENYLILRPRQLISAISHPSNLISKFLSFDSIPAIDEKNSITCIEDFKLMIEHLLSNNLSGVFNCSNEGVTTPYEISLLIKEMLKPELEVKKVTYENLLEKLPNRRVNTVLSNEKLKSTGFVPRPANLALMWCLKNYEK